MSERLSNIETSNKEKQRYARLSFIKENPQIAALVNKIVPKGNESDADRESRFKNVRPSDFTLSNASSEITQSIKDSDLIFQLLPEMGLVKQILVSSILSPKDLVNTEINYSNPDSELPSELTTSLIEIIRNHFDNVYKIKRLLPEILEDALFDTGSYPLAILPESSIDKIINSNKRVTLESLSDEFDRNGIINPVGLLGKSVEKKSSVSLESFFNDSGSNTFSIEDYSIKYKEIDFLVDVYDNSQYLKLPELKRRVTEDRISNIIAKRNLTGSNGSKISLESVYKENDNTDLKIESSFYTRRPNAHEYITRIESPSSSERDNIGHPLTMKLPSESCIPVHVPGNNKDHLGYFVIMDEQGNPLNNATSSDYYRQLGINLYNNNGQVASQLIGSTNAGTQGINPEMVKQKFNEAVAVYTNIIEKDLLNRLKNGIYGDNVEISKTSEVYRIMLSRSLVNKRSQLLFIPKELLTYFAFDYNDDGIGKSLTEKSKVLASIRSVLLFANTMASIKNSIGRAQAKITLDPKDRNPVETVEYMLHEFARHRRSTFPFGTYNPVDLVDYLGNAGIDVAVTGNPGYPETAFDVEYKQNNVTKPDSELEETMKKRHIQSFGLAPETVDLSMGVDFATSVVASNLLLSKRVLMYQEIFTESLKDFISKYTINSGILISDMKKIIIDNKEKIKGDLAEYSLLTIIKIFLKTLVISLPAPDSITLDNQMAAFDKYKEALEKSLDAYFSSEFLDSSNMGDLADAIGPTKEALKAYYLRKWLAENNVLPELAEITMLKTKDDNESDKFNLLDIMDLHVKGIYDSLKPYMEKIKARLPGDSIDTDTNVDDSSTNDMSDTDNDTSSSDDDFGGMDDFSTDETDADSKDTNEEETVEETVEETEETETKTTDTDKEPEEETSDKESETEEK
jgi:hypothetical protein